MPMAGFYVLNISPSRSQTHPNLPKGQPILNLPKRLHILTFPKGNHPNLPQGKGQVTLQLNISPLSFSPVGEMQVTTLLSRTG